MTSVKTYSVRGSKDYTTIVVSKVAEDHSSNHLSSGEMCSKEEGFGSNLIGSGDMDTESLALYEEELGNIPTLATFLRSFTIPGAEEKEASDRKRRKAKLGVLLGVYLPTLQHIFGIIMFLRLFWVVGSAGVLQALLLVFTCCLCTFLTSISMSAIATNGVVESGGSYFMISRNLGPEFGTAVGILFYLANGVATAMYLVGGVEILLTYVAPGLPQFGSGHDSDMQSMFNNFRIYASGFLLIEFAIVAVGVTFVQLFAPVTLSCVIISIIAIYIGSFITNESNSPGVCLLGEMLLKQSVLHNVSESFERSCNKSLLSHLFCNGTFCDPYYLANDMKWTAAVPGYASGVILDNLLPAYTAKGYAREGLEGQIWSVNQDITSTFFTLMAIYFPSVTGIMTGSNMSGDLRDPQKSIPLGTLAAQLTSSFVYLTFVLVFGGSIIRPVLLDKYGQSLGGGMVASQLVWPTQWVLLIGAFTSTIGAALQCLCSAPRLLQSIAKDDVLPFLHPFSVITKRGEPFRALLITCVISECAILIGNVDSIAPVVDFFFLMCYGFVNIVCALQTLLRAPNWRPRFKFYHWTLSLLGAALCLFIMFATYWYYAIVTLLLCAAIYKYVEYRGAKKEWGDGIRGLALAGARFSLLRIEDADPHTKNWRPQLLILMKVNDEMCPKYSKLLSFASQLKAGGGLVVCSTIFEGDFTNSVLREKAKAVEKSLKESMVKHKVKGFAKCVICSDVPDGISVCIQTTGIGALRPNTVVVGWPYTWQEEQDNKIYCGFLDAIHRVATADMCLLIPKGINLYPDTSLPASGTIDVWWIMHDGGLLIILPFLLKKHRVWRNCKIRVFAVATQYDNSVRMKECLDKWIYQLRIDAQVTVVEMPGADVTAYINQKTVQMVARSQFLKDLHLSNKEIIAEPQAVIDQIRLDSSVSSKAPECTSSAELVNASDSQFAQQKSPISSQTELTGDNLEMNAYTFSPSKASELRRLLAEQPDEADSTFMDLPPTGTLVDPGMSSETNIPVHSTGAAASSQKKVGSNDSSPTFSAKHAESSRLRKKLHTAFKLNMAIRERSSSADLVVLNLPGPPKNRESLKNYISFLEALTEGLDKVLLVRGTGKEVITIYS